eukprot:jgi/Botrbrau1/18760/Bobra.0386s0083.2
MQLPLYRGRYCTACCRVHVPTPRAPNASPSSYQQDPAPYALQRPLDHVRPKQTVKRFVCHNSLIVHSEPCLPYDRAPEPYLQHKRLAFGTKYNGSTTPNAPARSHPDNALVLVMQDLSTSHRM